MLRKEIRELARSYKLLFVPLVFAALAVAQPIGSKMLPLLLEGSPTLPEGTVIQIPLPSPGQVMTAVISQLQQLGTALMVLVAMGSIAGERASGVAATVLSKPVGRGVYLAAKAIAYGSLAVFSLAAAVTLSGFYTERLIGPLDWTQTVVGVLVYLPNLLLSVALTLFFSSFLPTPVAAGGASLVAVIGLNTLPRLLGEFARSVYPGALTAQTYAILTGSTVDATPPFVTTALLIGIFLFAGWWLLERQEV